VQTFARYAVTPLDGVAYGLLLFVVAAGLTPNCGMVDVPRLARGTLLGIAAVVRGVAATGVAALLTERSPRRTRAPRRTGHRCRPQPPCLRLARRVARGRRTQHCGVADA
jgi:hypothetical protein